MRTRGLRFISRGTRVVGWLQKKKKIANERRSKFLAACSVLNTTIREIWVALSKGPVTEKGGRVSSLHRRDGEEESSSPPGCPRISVITGGKSRIIGVGSRSSVEYRALGGTRMESRVVYRVTAMIRVPLRFK